MLRRKQPGAALFRLPGGVVFSIAGVVICLALVTQVDRSGLLILLATIGAALLNWAWVRNRKETAVRVP
jgi:hypothetical protein